LIALPQQDGQLCRAAEAAFEAARGITPKCVQEASKEMIDGVHSGAVQEAILTVLPMLGK